MVDKDKAKGPYVEEPEVLEAAAEQTAPEQQAEVVLDSAELADRVRTANEVVQHRILWSLGVGLIPVPLVDMAGFMIVQLEMLHKLAGLFEVPFRRDLGKSIVGSLLGAVAPGLLASPLASLIKFIPVIGYTAGAAMMSISGAAATYALGKVFIPHFANGGTLESFDADKMKARFAAKYEEGKAYASSLRRGKATA